MAGSQIKFSIIIPIYDVEEYLEQCVKSVLIQTLHDFELILVDDGSPDRCGVMCDLFAASDNRVKVIHQSNSGSSSARNSGIKAANGQYILFLDSDDYWIQNDVLETLWHRIEQVEPDLLSFNFKKRYGARFTKPYYDVETMPKDADGITFYAEHSILIACPWNKAIRSALFKENNLMFIERITAEDVDWCARLAKAAIKFDYINIEAVVYRQREGSITSSSSLKKVSCFEGNVSAVERITESASERIKQILYPYLAYQVGVLLFNIASLCKQEQSFFVDKIERHLSYLAYSCDKKIMLIRFVNSVFGHSMILKMMALYKKIRG